MDQKTFVLENEEGKQVEFEILDFLNYDYEKYAVLLSKDDTGEIIVLRCVETDHGIELRFVNDQVGLKVYNLFKEKYQDEFKFED